MQNRDTRVGARQIAEYLQRYLQPSLPYRYTNILSGSYTASYTIAFRSQKERLFASGGILVTLFGPFETLFGYPFLHFHCEIFKMVTLWRV